jgi:hypothetical protein
MSKKKAKASARKPARTKTVKFGKKKSADIVEAAKKPIGAPDDTTWALLEAARRDQRKEEIEIERIKGELKVARNACKLATKRIGELLDDASDGQMQIPFDKALQKIGAKAAAKANAHDESVILSAINPDAWESVRLDSLQPAIKPAKLKALAECNVAPCSNGIHTIGDVQEFQAKHTTFWVKDVKGLGPAGGEQVENALAEYWREHPPRTPAQLTLDAAMAALKRADKFSGFPADDFENGRKILYHVADRVYSEEEGKRISDADHAKYALAIEKLTADQVVEILMPKEPQPEQPVAAGAAV